MRMQQEAQRDAPDPRESRPPCYADAILLPRLDGSFASLDELGGGRLKHKRRRRKTENEEEEVEEEVPLRRNRCRSEEVLSMREVVAGSVRSPVLPPRIHPFEIEPIDRDHSSNEEPEPEELHYHSTDILNMDHSQRTRSSPPQQAPPATPSRTRSSPPQQAAPATPSRTRSSPLQQAAPTTTSQPRSSSSESFEDIRNFDRSNNTLDRSPYAKRKLTHMGSFKGNNKITAGPSTAIEITEDHFKRERKSSSSSSDESSEFITIKAGVTPSKLSDDDEDDEMVVVPKYTTNV